MSIPYLAFDLGAESGRAVAGALDGGQLALEEIHRFPNEAVEVCGTLYWDILALFRNVLQGARAYVRRYGDCATGIGIDSWSMDFGLIAPDGHLLENPVHYRDRRTTGILERITDTMAPRTLFGLSGMSRSPIQTLCQLVALRRGGSASLHAGATFLMIPDLLAYFLTGTKCCERTNAINTQLYDTRSGTWCAEVFRAFDLPLDLMPPLVDPGTVLGGLAEGVARQTGMRHATVVAPCSHDTGSAAAAVPGEGDEDWAFLSSGTWTVAGALAPRPITSEAAFALGVCNELTFGSYFLCRNIMGLWLLQECRRCWEAVGQSFTYESLAEMADAVPAGGPVVDPDDPCFLAPEDMREAVLAYCRRTGQPEPEGPAQMTRCILESLALCYRQRLSQIGELLGRRFRVLHIVGGGCLNRCLCQLTADATGIPVLAGPAEATVMGNLLLQAVARGYVGSAAEVRRIVRRSSALVRYEPRAAARWDSLYSRYLAIQACAGKG